MARWQDVIDSEPGFAETTQALFDAHKHKTIATLRKDGSPRISGIEMQFSDAEAWLGMMPDSLKLADVLRDPRVAVHSASVDPPEDQQKAGEWAGDAKLAGRLVELEPEARAAIADASQPGAYFRIDISEVVETRVGEPPDHLVISLWRPGQPLQQTKRY